MQYIEENELMHYGVLGMKWGVKHSPSRAFTKSVKKAQRLHTKIEKRDKKLLKATMKRDKVEKRYSGIGFASREDLAKATSKHYRASKKLLKAKKKSQRWEKQMKKTFKNVRISDISKEARSAGREYVNMLLND